ncbi:MAG: 3-hydroxyacyl-CoA dehydrogenase family protein [Solirubrobacterales bacterium]|nr:3-hydroxyacyl-CoA dehydrogenase family protein [Solirubrobacterales bacterium]
MSTIQRVVVVGGGIMGSGIAQVLATAGLDVTVVDVSEDALSRTTARIAKSLKRFVASGKLTQEDADAALARVGTSTDLTASAATADHAIETVVEDLDVKRSVLAALDAACRPDVVLASNTSQFSISLLASATGRPDRVIGSHWFNPPPLMDLVELVRGVQTSDATLETALWVAGRCNRRTVVCQKDTPGFITSRLIVALGLEAMRIVEEGIATAEDVDLACVKAFNHAMGPLATMDFSGLDTTLHVADNMREQYGERFLAPQNLRVLVQGGHLGRKTGRGFAEHGAVS